MVKFEVVEESDSEIEKIGFYLREEDGAIYLDLKRNGVYDCNLLSISKDGSLCRTMIHSLREVFRLNSKHQIGTVAELSKQEGG